MDYLELKVADIAISLSLHQHTASILDIKIYQREVTAKFANFFKGSDFWQIEQYDTERTQSRDINHHRSLDVHHLDHYSNERNGLCVDRTAKHNKLKPLSVDRSFDPLSNGMHNEILTKSSLRTL